MKKLLIAFIMCMILVVSASANSVVSNDPRLTVTLVSQEPTPAEPGEVITLKFKIENEGVATNENMLVELVPEFPLSVYSEKTKNIGRLQAGQTGADAEIVEFEVKIDEDAIERDEKIDLRVYLDGTWRVFEDFEVKLRTRDLVLELASIKSTPKLIEPGDDFELSLTLGNGADSLIRNVKVNLDLASSTIPFAPSESLAEGYTYQINSKASKIITFDLVALPDAQGGVYKIPVNISYSDESGTLFAKNDLISLRVTSVPDLLVIVENSEINAEKREGRVSINVVNRGLTDIKLLTATLSENNDFELKSEPYVYVGNIDSDDYETADFDIALNTYNEKITLPLMLEYRDATNKKYTQEVEIELKTQSRGRAATVISGIVRLIVTLAILIGVVYGGYRFYKKRKSARRKG